MMALSQQAPGEFGGGIVSVRHHGHRFFQASRRQIAQFVQQGARVRLLQTTPLVNAGGHRHGQISPRCLHQDGDGLEGMAHDKGSLGVTADS